MSDVKPPTPIQGKYIEVIVDEDGDGVQIEAHGFNGVGCREATKHLEAALGAVTLRTVKQTVAQTVKQKIGR